MSHARPPEGARTAARQGEGTPAIISAAAGAARTPEVATKLPAVGTTIFTVMSALATETGAVNLGQGFPDFECDPKLVQAVTVISCAGL